MFTKNPSAGKLKRGACIKVTPVPTNQKLGKRSSSSTPVHTHIVTLLEYVLHISLYHHSHRHITRVCAPYIIVSPLTTYARSSFIVMTLLYVASESDRLGYLGLTLKAPIIQR